jgi:hypothetical protein
MQGLKTMQELAYPKTFAILAKVIAATLGGILALVLSGDIDSQGRITVRRNVVLKFAFAVCISLFGGSFIIESYGFGGLTQIAQGFIMFLCAVFGLLFIGIIYQAFALMRGKPLDAVVSEVSSAFTAIFSKKP